MTHAEIVATIESQGGRLVASFTLDSRGETVGHETRNRAYRCSSCGQLGHSVTRCTGADSAPRPTHAERRRQR